MTEEELAELRATLTRTWVELGIVTDGLDAATTSATTLPEPVEVPLPSLLEPASAEGVAPFILGDVLGEGGMGVVMSATQTAMQRTVAVKTLRSEVPRVEHALQLLREGRVTGRLEHPNIVPIHAIGRDESGQPLIVMKRIAGTPWMTLLDDVAEEERGSSGFLREHLGILKQVAGALHFAHSEGLLHRDVKPDNIMIGAFDEVYLVDWGVAVAISDGGLPGVPHARDVRRIEGTPVYMAPEMAIGKGDELSERSDVYLLGATLHHILTGTAPHDAVHVQAVLLKSFSSVPHHYGPHIPAELAAIAHRAMARRAEDRYASAADFALAIDEFLTHAGSLELCDEAERRAAELDDVPQAGESEERVDALFHEARFAFEQSLRGWPENARAKRGRNALIEAMVGHELRRGNARVARNLLRQHDDPPRELSDETDAAVARVEAMERDVDVTFGVRQRIRRIYIGAIGWAALCFTFGFLTRSGIYPIDHLRFALFGSVFLVGSIISSWIWRRSTLGTATNRRVAVTGMLLFLSSLALWPLLGAYGVSMAGATVVGALMTGSLWATLAIDLGRSWLPFPIGHLMVVIGASLWPEYHFEIFGLVAIPLLFSARLMAQWMGGEEGASRTTPSPKA